MAFFPIGPLRFRIGKDKNTVVTVFGLAVATPALGALWWLRCGVAASRRRGVVGLLLAGFLFFFLHRCPARDVCA